MQGTHPRKHHPDQRAEPLLSERVEKTTYSDTSPSRWASGWDRGWQKPRRRKSGGGMWRTGGATGAITPQLSDRKCATWPVQSCGRGRRIVEEQ